ncbi:MAG: tail fiber domain-containing protein [Saprospiraceae bacterium]|nr:tail fiber domain-containing protein [Saprospiraceae bacterium]
MKKLFTISALFFFFLSFIQAQSPQAFNYQAVARDANNNPYLNTTLSLRISLLRNSEFGITDFSERHLVTTSDLGVFTLNIGKGTVLTGIFDAVDWASHSYYLKVEMDPSGGTNYLDMGVSQLLSVPYALYARESGDGETDYDTDPENEIQSLSLNGNALILSNGGGFVTLPEDMDNQTLTVSGTNLIIEHGNTVDLSVLQDGVTDADADPENELQTLSFDITTNELSLSNGNTISIPTGGTDADANPLNELQNLSLDGSILTLSDDGGSVDLSILQDGVTDADANPYNEIQTLSKSGNTVTLSNGGGSFVDDVTDADSNPQNELQQLSLNANILSLSNGGGSVELPTDEASSLWSENDSGIDYPSGNVGINTTTPYAALEVYNDDSDWEAGYFYLSNTANGYSALAGITEGSGSGVSGTSLGEGAGGFFENDNDNNLALQTGAGRVGIGTDEADGRMEIYHNSTPSDPTLLLREEANDYARLDFKNTFNGNKKWSIGGYAGSSDYSSKLSFQFKQDGYAGQDHLTILGDGFVGIGNTNPDQSLVVGQNIGTGWSIPAITVGDNTGGAIEVGNSQYSLSIDAASPYNRIASTSPDGFGLGEIEMRTSGIAIGESPGSPAGYMMALVHEDYGLLIERAGTSNNWEIYAVDNPNHNLSLFSNGYFRGEFDGTSGEYYSVSDRNLKQNINPIGNVLDQVMQLKASRYQYKDNNPGQKQSIGFIAQDVQQLFPELVTVSEDKRSEGIHAVNYAGFSILAIKAIQEQQTQIEALNAELEAQKKKAEALEARLVRLERLLEE